MEGKRVNLSDLSDQDRLILGLRFRLKHIREAIVEAEAGGVPEGFEFSPNESKHAMLAELRLLETDVQRMLSDNGAQDGGTLN